MAVIDRRGQLVFGVLLTALVGVAASGASSEWPTHGWPRGTPGGVGLDEHVLADLDRSEEHTSELQSL